MKTILARKDWETEYDYNFFTPNQTIWWLNQSAIYERLTEVAAGCIHIPTCIHTYFRDFVTPAKTLNYVNERRRFEGEPGEISGRGGERQSWRLSRHQERKRSSLVRLQICRSVTYPRARGLHRFGLVQERRLDRGPRIAARKSRGKTGCPRNGPASQWHKPLWRAHAYAYMRSLKRIIVSREGAQNVRRSSVSSKRLRKKNLPFSPFFFPLFHSIINCATRPDVHLTPRDSGNNIRTVNDQLTSFIFNLFYRRPVKLLFYGNEIHKWEICRNNV